MRVSGNRESHHLEPLVGAGNCGTLDFQRLCACGYENELVQSKRFERIGGENEVADVGRIESAAEDPDPHAKWLASPPAPGRNRG